MFLVVCFLGLPGRLVVHPARRDMGTIPGTDTTRDGPQYSTGYNTTGARAVQLVRTVPCGVWLRTQTCAQTGCIPDLSVATMLRMITTIII